MLTSDFDYDLPQNLIAQKPVEPRDSSRLMHLKRSDQSITHHIFRGLPDLLSEGDVLVFNDSRVIPARVKGTRHKTGGQVEILLLKRLAPCIWEAMVKPAKKMKQGSKISLNQAEITAEIIEEKQEGIRIVHFSAEQGLYAAGEMPLPPYIHTPLSDAERYQTIYSRISGSVAAPTSGLHFTPELINTLQAKHVETLFVTLHIGLDTFRPLNTENPLEHDIHTEYGCLPPGTGLKLKAAREAGRRIVAVGTSTARLLEHTAGLDSYEGWVGLYILPGYRFKVLDGLITNFHLPRSTLLMLVSAFASKEFILRSYKEAIKQQYRFYSFGDATLIL